MRLQSTEPSFLCGWLGGFQTTNEERTPFLFALGIEVEILLLFAKDCNGKPDLKGNALINEVKMFYSEPHLLILFLQSSNGNRLFISISNWSFDAAILLEITDFETKLSNTQITPLTSTELLSQKERNRLSPDNTIASILVE